MNGDCEEKIYVENGSRITREAQVFTKDREIDSSPVLVARVEDSNPKIAKNKDKYGSQGDKTNTPFSKSESSTSLVSMSSLDSTNEADWALLSSKPHVIKECEEKNPSQIMPVTHSLMDGDANRQLGNTLISQKSGNSQKANILHTVNTSISDLGTESLNSSTPKQRTSWVSVDSSLGILNDSTDSCLLSPDHFPLQPEKKSESDIVDSKEFMLPPVDPSFIDKSHPDLSKSLTVNQDNVFPTKSMQSLFNVLAAFVVYNEDGHVGYCQVKKKKGKKEKEGLLFVYLFTLIEEEKRKGYKLSNASECFVNLKKKKKKGNELYYCSVVICVWRK